MIDDLKFEHGGVSFDIEIHPTGVYVEMYDDDNYTGFPLTVDRIEKVRDYLNRVLEEVE